MRRIGRWMLNALTALSLLLCVAACAMWVRSYASESFLLEFQRGRCLLIGIDVDAKAVRLARESTVWDTFLKELNDPVGDYNGVTYGPPREYRRFGFEWVRGTAQLNPSGDTFNIGAFWMVGVPLWYIAVAAAAGPAAVLVRRRMAARRRGKNQCAKCGYDLTANVSGVCPECGMAVGKALRGKASDGPVNDRQSVDALQIRVPADDRSADR